ncbi:putative E3 ubiquitin-protein ligase UNKL [Taenia solium]|eukprot:TsM_000487800 transcript=TsM_000487800 gene=TsM_000487800
MKRLILIVRREEDVDDHLTPVIGMGGLGSNPGFGTSFSSIYKSTKCNDVLNSGYCPRGPFCAFAHADSEMTLGRTFLQSAAAAAAVAAAATSGLSTSSPRQHDASPVSSSTSASSSGVFSPSIRPSMPAITSLQASHTYPTVVAPFEYLPPGFDRDPLLPGGKVLAKLSA